MRTRLSVALLASAAALVWAAGCDHPAPFVAASHDSDRPFSATPPVRLTLAPGADTDPVWLPDGSGILYGAHFAEGSLAESCLALLPPTGGRITRRLCPDSPLTPDTSDRYVAPAAAPDGRIAFVYTRRRAEAAGFSSYQLVLGSLRFGGATRLLAELPFTLDGEPTYNGISHLRWLSPDTIIYRGDFEGRVCLSGPPCAAYEARSGRGLVLHRLSTGERQLIPGTRYASSVTVSEPGVILYTLGGDTRVFRRNLATGVVTVVYDAGSDIVREVEAAGNRLVLLAGGSVSFYEIESVGLIQVDRGGQIRVLDLATGEVTVVDLSAPWRQLALSPDGRRLVAESSGDLFLLELP